MVAPFGSAISLSLSAALQLLSTPLSCPRCAASAAAIAAAIAASSAAACCCCRLCVAVARRERNSRSFGATRLPSISSSRLPASTMRSRHFEDLRRAFPAIFRRKSKGSRSSSCCRPTTLLSMLREMSSECMLCSTTSAAKPMSVTPHELRSSVCSEWAIVHRLRCSKRSCGASHSSASAAVGCRAVGCRVRRCPPMCSSRIRGAVSSPTSISIRFPFR
mmetsp:Transcript_76008/g.126704  ORF Transcript_76008/g.126704 Transcript_76008/m.126704 type:complete len:219 (-) Transcript_76008:440-1096(-)